MINMSIECTVRNCKHHHQVEQFCMLDHVRIGTEQKKQALEKQNTDCEEFEAT